MKEEVSPLELEVVDKGEDDVPELLDISCRWRKLARIFIEDTYRRSARPNEVYQHIFPGLSLLRRIALKFVGLPLPTFFGIVQLAILRFLGMIILVTDSV